MPSFQLFYDAKQKTVQIFKLWHYEASEDFSTESMKASTKTNEKKEDFEPIVFGLHSTSQKVMMLMNNYNPT